jgi:hypothetical protein
MERKRTEAEPRRLSLAKSGPELVPKRIKRRKLRTLNDIRRYLANLLLQLEADHVERQKATSLAYIASLIQKAIVDATIEPQLRELEKRLGG